MNVRIKINHTCKMHAIIPSTLIKDIIIIIIMLLLFLNGFAWECIF